MSASHKGYSPPQESTASLTLQTTLLTIVSFSSISEGRHSNLNSISQTGRPSLNFRNRSVPKYPTHFPRIVFQRSFSSPSNRSVNSPRLLLHPLSQEESSILPEQPKCSGKAPPWRRIASWWPRTACSFSFDNLQLLGQCPLIFKL